ncbi:MAG TPA: hypothetical protein PK955_08255, partial [Methanoregulaceae archaeon]|nr:hypothetical protein [Methanoregulaceae archaeon]
MGNDTSAQRNMIQRNMMRWRAITALCAVATVILIFLIYFPSFRAPYYFDDMVSIKDNPHIRITTLSPDALWDAGFKSKLSKRPVVYISFALNYYVHGLEVPGYHVVNVVIHLIAGLFIFLVFRDTLVMTKEKHPGLLIGKSTSPYALACAAALIWLVHPL